MVTKIISLKTRIEEITDEHKIAFESDHDEEKKFILQMEALRTFPWKEP